MELITSRTLLIASRPSRDSAIRLSYVLYDGTSKSLLIALPVQLNANQPVGNYWIRALASSPGLAGVNGGINSAILRYVGAPKKEPAGNGLKKSTAPLNEVDLHPLMSPSAVSLARLEMVSMLTSVVQPGRPGVGKADKNINLAMTFVRL